MTDDTRVFRYEIPVDAAWHDIELNGIVVHVATRRITAVEFWAEHHDGMPLHVERFRAFGTGHPLDCTGGISHVGTAIVPGGDLVWHLYRQLGPIEVST